MSIRCSRSSGLRRLLSRSANRPAAWSKLSARLAMKRAWVMRSVRSRSKPNTSRVVDRLQRRDTLCLAGLRPLRLAPACVKDARQMLEPVHPDEPVDQPESQRTDDENDDRHVGSPPTTSASP